MSAPVVVPPPGTRKESRSTTSNFPQMVSHAEVPEGSRRAPSVTSRSSRNRHHHSRSRQGPSSYPSQNEFPFFAQTGDVEIVIECEGQEKRYLLHRLMLAQGSGFFDAGMSDEWSRSHAQLAASEKKPEQALSIIGEEQSSSDVSASMMTADQASRTAPGRKRWRYELNWATVGDEDEPILVQKVPQYQQFTPTPAPPPIPAQVRPKPPASQSFFRSMASLSLGPSHHGHASQSAANLVQPADPALSNPLIRDYDNLFRCFYQFAPIINTVNIASAYGECKSLLGLADMYDALAVVGSRVEHHLLAFSSRLFKQIAKYPPSYLKLGYMAKSKIIFSEALIHVVGQWPAAQPYLKPGNPNSGYEVPLIVLDLIEDKVDELEELKMRTEAKLFRLTLTTSRGERVNPSNDYLGWLAMSLFRQWLAESTTPEVKGILKNTSNVPRPGSNQSNTPFSASATTTNLPQPTAAPTAMAVNTGRIYRLLGSTNSQAYLGHDELKRFLKLQPSGSSSGGSALYTRDNLRRFERKIEQVKNIARDAVKPLTRNCLELDVRILADGGGGGLGYLTCIKVEEEDIPW